MGPLPVVLIDERVSERHPTGMILRESDCGQRSHQHRAFVRGCRRALCRNQAAAARRSKAAGLIWSSVECRRPRVLTKETRLFILFLRSIWILI